MTPPTAVPQPADGSPSRPLPLALGAAALCQAEREGPGARPWGGAPTALQLALLPDREAREAGLGEGCRESSKRRSERFAQASSLG